MFARISSFVAAALGLLAAPLPARSAVIPNQENDFVLLSGLRLLLTHANAAHLPLFFWDVLIARGVPSTAY